MLLEVGTSHTRTHTSLPQHSLLPIPSLSLHHSTCLPAHPHTGIGRESAAGSGHLTHTHTRTHIITSAFPVKQYPQYHSTCLPAHPHTGIGGESEAVLLEVGEPRLVSLPLSGGSTMGAPSILICHDGFFRCVCVCSCVCVRVCVCVCACVCMCVCVCVF